MAIEWPKGTFIKCGEAGAPPSSLFHVSLFPLGSTSALTFPVSELLIPLCGKKMEDEPKEFVSGLTMNL